MEAATDKPTSLLEKAKLHPAMSIAASLLTGWAAGIATYKGALEIMRLDTVPNGAYVTRADIEKSYVPRDNEQRYIDQIRQLNGDLNKAREELSAAQLTLTQERDARQLAEKDQSNKTEFCRSLLDQVKNLEGRKDSVENLIDRMLNRQADVFANGHIQVARQEDESIVKDLRRQSTELQDRLVGLEKQVAGCIGFSPFSS